MNPREIVARLEDSIGIEGAPRSLRAAIETVLVVTYGYSAIGASEDAEMLHARVERLIIKRDIQSRSRGILATLMVIGATSQVIAGSCYILPEDSQTIADAKRQRIYSSALLLSMQSLTFQEFEIFGSRVLAEIGATKFQVTRQSGDQGIDFFGTFSFGILQVAPLPFFKLAHDVNILFAGQAKHYPRTTIGPNLIRELVGSVTLARMKWDSTASVNISNQFPIKLLSPVVTLLFSTGPISSGARQLADFSGILVASGEQLALFLADRKIGMVKKNDMLEYDETLFRKWLYHSDSAEAD